VTGTGSAPVVAKLAKEAGALTVAFATKPFKGEGKMRLEAAEQGLAKLSRFADTVITISNDKLLDISPKLPLNDAFKVLDELLMHSIKALVEMVTKPGLVNVDFNDLKTIMQGGGVSVIGIGSSSDPSNKVEEAVDGVINCPLIEYDIGKATGALIKVTGGPDMTLMEAEKVTEILQSKINPGARIIWGAAVEPDMKGSMNVMVVLTGVESPQIFGRDKTLDNEIGKDLGIDMLR